MIGRLLPTIDVMISAEVTPVHGATVALARELQAHGFRVLSLDDTIRVDGPQSLWTSIFRVQFEEKRRPAPSGPSDESSAYHKALESTVTVPADLKDLIEDIAFVEPPELF